MGGFQCAAQARSVPVPASFRCLHPVGAPIRKIRQRTDVLASEFAVTAYDLALRRNLCNNGSV